MEEAAKFGFTAEEVAEPPVEIFPDNIQTVDLFISMLTQWRTGNGGPIGLDYNVLYRKLDRMKLSEQRYVELEEEIRTMEIVALTTMRAANKKPS